MPGTTFSVVSRRAPEASQGSRDPRPKVEPPVTSSSLPNEPAQPAQGQPTQGQPAHAQPGLAEGSSQNAQPVTVPQVRASKRSSGSDPLVMLTAYDAPMARVADAGGVDLILVGDSVANAVLGYEDTLQMTTASMAHHVAAVCRARTRALVVADMPWLSYHLGHKEAVENASVLVRAGAKAVKLEGGRERQGVIGALLDAEIPVMGHLGLTPQSVNKMGGYKVQARAEEDAARLLEDALALEQAGCFAVVLEGIPASLGTKVTEQLSIPTIGIGAGPGTDGQVLVFHDLLGWSEGRKPRFVRVYADLAHQASQAIAQWAFDVRSGGFPSPEETYS